MIVIEIILFFGVALLSRKLCVIAFTHILLISECARHVIRAPARKPLAEIRLQSHLQIAALVRVIQPGAHVFVDAMSSFGAIPLGKDFGNTVRATVRPQKMYMNFATIKKLSKLVTFHQLHFLEHITYRKLEKLSRRLCGKNKKCMKFCSFLCQEWTMLIF
jgi:hypothetical protein